MATRREYDDATRAAVMAALLAGQSINSVAKEYEIPAGTVTYWRAKTESFKIIDPQKKDEISEKLHEYLMSALGALIAQTKVFSNEKWLKGKPANELAVLHGVIADKGIRLLEAKTSGSQGCEDDSSREEPG